MKPYCSYPNSRFHPTPPTTTLPPNPYSLYTLYLRKSFILSSSSSVPVKTFWMQRTTRRKINCSLQLVTPSLTCSFAVNYHLNFPRPVPTGLVAQLVEQRDLFRRSWVRTPTGSEIFSLSPCGPISFLGLTLRRYWVFLHWSLNFAELSLSLAKIFCLAVLLE